ncbi:MAG: Ig-like domain-containing protein, partial [Candidatus Paceibacterota bacterium]
MKKIHGHLVSMSKQYAKWHTYPHHEFVHYVVVALALIGTFSYVGVPYYIEASEQPTVALTGKAEELGGLNTELLSALARFEASSASEKSQAMNGLAVVAEKRKALMLKKMKTNPLQALLYTLPSEVAQKFPAEIQASLEKQVKEEGKMNTYHADYLGTEGKNFVRGEFLYDLITTKNARYELHFAGKEPEFPSGTTVSVDGVALDGQMVLASASQDGGLTVNTLATIVPNSTNKTLVLAFNFSNNSTSKPLATSTLEELMFTGSRSLATFYNENSFGKATFSGDVYGWFTIPATPLGDCTDYYTWATLAKNQAVSAGYVLSNYTNFMYIFSGTSTGCSWAGLGELGGGSTWIPAQYATPYYAEMTLEHETGHNLGARHSAATNCGPLAVDVASKCSFLEYGDPSDVMGDWNYVSSLARNVANLFNAPHKLAKSWGVSTAQIQTITTSGVYTVTPLEVNDGTVKVLKIAKSTGAGPGSTPFYYVSYIKPVGFSSFLPLAFTQGASVHAWNNVNTVNTYLVDTQPGTAGNYKDAALKDGVTFSDPISGVSITQQSHTADSVTLQVSIVGTSCYKTAPKLTLSSPVFRTSTPTSYTYKATLTNNDMNCSPSTFSISASAPAGWTTIPSQVSVSSQVSTSTSVVVTPPPSLVNGTTTIVLSATDILDTTRTSSATGYYSFYAVSSTSTATSTPGNSTSTPGADTIAPVVSITSPANNATLAQNGNLKITAQATDNVAVVKIQISLDGTVVGTCLNLTTCSASYQLKPLA